MAKDKSVKKDGAPMIMTLAFWVCFLVFLGSGGYLGFRYVVEPYRTNEAFKGFKQAHEDIGTGDNLPRNADGSLIAFNDLRKMNEDIIGWITVPGTNIDYPVVKAPDEKDEFYLKHNIEKKSDRNGTIFADYELKLEYKKKNQNIVLFGHHMRSGIMFNNLMKYDPFTSGTEFYKTFPVLTFNTIYEPGQWVVFGVMKINANIKPQLANKQDNPKFFGFIESEFNEEKGEFTKFIKDLRDRSLLDTTSCVQITTEDELLLLSTCSYEYDNYRTVFMCRKVRPGEQIDVSSAKKAANPIMPDGWKRGLGKSA